MKDSPRDHPKELREILYRMFFLFLDYLYLVLVDDV